jgi:hypothetical protein
MFGTIFSAGSPNTPQLVPREIQVPAKLRF